MFLPDGRVLVMDKDLYQKTLEQSIVLDLFEAGQSQAAQSQLNDLSQS